MDKPEAPCHGGGCILIEELGSDAYVLIGAGGSDGQARIPKNVLPVLAERLPDIIQAGSAENVGEGVTVTPLKRSLCRIDGGGGEMDVLIATESDALRLGEQVAKL